MPRNIPRTCRIARTMHRLIHCSVAVSPERRAIHPAGAEPREPRRLSERDQKRREELIALLREHGGNLTAVARVLGKARNQIQRWIKRYRVDAAEFRR